jgi:small subunit ribosomal protein S1
MPSKDVFQGWLTEEYDYQRPRQGQIRQGEILKIEENGVTIDLGLKHDGFVPRSDVELLDEETSSSLEPGQVVRARIRRLEDQEGNLLLSLYQVRFEKDWDKAQELLGSGAICQGKVTDHNRGGLIVEFGHVRAFVPASHLARRASSHRLDENREDYIGQELLLKVIEVDRNRRRLILSERLATQQVQEQNKERLLSELVEGQICRGVVSGIRNFGAFVDLGGAEGLIHISELAWRRIRNPQEVLQVGDEIEVYVLRLDHERKRIGLSLKRLQPNPWELVDETYTLDQMVSGTVTKVVDFGAFVALDLGIEGLVHIGELADPPPSDPRELVSSGDELMLRVVRIDSFRERIALSLKQADGQERDEWLTQPADGQSSHTDEAGRPPQDGQELSPLQSDEVDETAPVGSEQGVEEDLYDEALPLPVTQSEEDVWVSMLQDVETE